MCEEKTLMEAVATGADAVTVPGQAAAKPREQPRRKKSRAAEPVCTWIYLGPTVPRTQLIENSIVRGTRAGVEQHYGDALVKYPAANRLIVADADLAVSRAKVWTPGNLLNKAYVELVLAIKL